MLLLAGIVLLSGSLLDAVIYRRTGGEVVIFTGSDPGRITAITWKHNEDIAVEWYGGEPSAFRHFNGCTSLDIWTGALTISNLTRNHSGSYTAEINNRVADTTEVRLISPVPKPTVSKRCDAEKTYCTLTCEGNTTDAGPVTYSWQIFDAHNYYEGQQINLTKENPDPWYCCEMKNPISSERSEKFLNPFSSRNRMFILVPIILLLIGFVVICIYVTCKSMKENSLKKEEIEVQDPIPETPESNNQTENSPKEEEIEVQDHRSETPEINTQTENSPKKEEIEVQDHKSETPENNNQTENSPKKEEIEVQVHKSETPENNHQTENSPKEEEIEVQVHRSETPEVNNQTDESEEESIEDETTRLLLEEPNHCISVSA